MKTSKLIWIIYFVLFSLFMCLSIIIGNPGFGGYIIGERYFINNHGNFIEMNKYCWYIMKFMTYIFILGVPVILYLPYVEPRLERIKAKIKSSDKLEL